jgi:hypothetical protein
MLRGREREREEEEEEGENRTGPFRKQPCRFIDSSPHADCVLAAEEAGMTRSPQEMIMIADSDFPTIGKNSSSCTYVLAMSQVH